jgi:hypothetical protein
LLALIDGDIRTPPPAISRLRNYLKIATRKLCKIAFKFSDELKQGPTQFVSKRLRYLWLLWRLRNLKAASGDTATQNLTLEQALLLAENSYRPQPYAGSAILLRFHDEAWAFGPDPLMGWGGLIQGGLEVVDLPGGHITGMHPSHSARMADILERSIQDRQRQAAAC